MIRIFALFSMIIFTPSTYYLSQMNFGVELAKKEKKNSLAKFLDVNLLKKYLIHDFHNRHDKGELTKLRRIFEATSKALETQKVLFDINKKDHELEEREIERVTQENDLDATLAEDSDSDEDNKPVQDIEIIG